MSARSGHRERQALAIVKALRPVVEGARFARLANGDTRRRYLLVEVGADGKPQAWWRPVSELEPSDQRETHGFARVVWVDRPDVPAQTVRLDGINRDGRCAECGDIRPHRAFGMCNACRLKARRADLAGAA